MISNNKIKYIQSLKTKKFRQKYNNFIIEGDKMVRELLQHPEIEIEGIYALPDWIETNKSSLNVHSSIINLVNERELKKISALTTPNRVLAIAQQRSLHPEWSTLSDSLCLYLDGIQDPGNMGTILRVADWFGLDWVFSSPHSVELYNPKVIQASMGAFLRVKTSVISFDQVRQHLPQTAVYGTVLDGRNMFDMQLKAQGIIVIGSEGQGIAPTTLQHIDHLISIPAHAASGAESLNAAIATGIVCALFRKG